LEEVVFDSAVPWTEEKTKDAQQMNHLSHAVCAECGEHLAYAYSIIAFADVA
jgi:hypothetical protein